MRIEAKLQKHRRVRNGWLAASWVLFLAGWAAGWPSLWGTGLLLVNGYALWLMATDKKSAKTARFRIPEGSLLLLAATGAPAGILLGMLLFHHKTKHRMFQIIPPLCFLMYVAVFGYWLIGQNF
ncbi:DUF1294 domain-containing protein [Brevibacillus fulvus]|uniref:Uncharacterized membrane protein YsdA (DUF1294 family) n=1 Tax=Brevibacillus fulvus TaxID=1125967 RepID=A0A939BU41_9BACL|nr:DUF1294 domain-containing protein [Brevibacillus fulvus]MBM7590119.1 uncharacterized membrane protein YsdA (DUF1294 family) [Brevibacillus fulvus]